MSISAYEVLPNGTKVHAGNQYGEVVSSKMVNAVPCGHVALHTVLFTEKRVRAFGSNYKIVKIPAKAREVNYSFIEVVGE